MNRRLTTLGALGLGAALVATFAAGCDTARPGGGVLNTDPATLESDSKPAMRTDFQTPPQTGGDASLADSAASSPSGTGNDAGTGGRNAGQKGNPKGSTGPDASPSPSVTAENPRDTPPRIEASTPGGAQGETKPAGNINTGTPRSPQ
jgi:hypothetical protein